MGDRVRLPFATNSYQLDQLPVSAQRVVNFYAEKEPPDAKTDTSMIGCPGLVSFTPKPVGAGPIRQMRVMNNVLYVVSGVELWSVNQDGVSTLLGTGILGSDVVSMSDNGNQVIIVNGTSGWVYTILGFASALSATPAAGGSGYAVNDTITLAGGTSTLTAILSVMAVDGGGGVTAAIVNTPGAYQAIPDNPVAQASSSGSGTGATFNVVWSGPVNGFTEITDPNFKPAKTVTFFDEYFILEAVGTNEWFFSNILDGTTYNALDFETAEVQSDFVVGIVNQQENLLVFGQKSIETWYDTGANDNPFSRYDGATVERGCVAPLTLVKEDNSVFFLGDDLIFYRLDGVLPHRLSTHAIEGAWQKYSTCADAFAFSYTYEGHKFVTMTFPTANATWVYDIASGFWHERESYISTTQQNGKWRGNCTATFFGKTLIGDAFGGGVGMLSVSAYQEYGTQMLGLLITPHVHKQRKRVFISCLELDISSGVGLATGQGDDPQLMLEISRDGGRTYANLQDWQSLGRIGEYEHRARWKKLGQAFVWTFKFTISDPVPRNIIAAYADVSEGM